MLAFVVLHSANTDNLVIEACTIEAFRLKHWWIEDLTVDSVVMLQAIRNYFTVGKNRLGFAQGSVICLMQRISESLMFKIVRKPAVWTIPKVIKNANMMNEPKNFMTMRDQVRLGAKADHPISRLKIYPAIGHHLLKQQIRRIDLREIYFFYLMPLLLEHYLEPIDNVACTPIQKRDK